MSALTLLTSEARTVQLNVVGRGTLPEDDLVLRSASTPIRPRCDHGVRRTAIFEPGAATCSSSAAASETARAVSSRRSTG